MGIIPLDFPIVQRGWNHQAVWVWLVLSICWRIVGIELTYCCPFSYCHMLLLIRLLGYKYHGHIVTIIILSIAAHYHIVTMIYIYIHTYIDKPIYRNIHCIEYIILISIKSAMVTLYDHIINLFFKGSTFWSPPESKAAPQPWATTQKKQQLNAAQRRSQLQRTRLRAIEMARFYGNITGFGFVIF